MAAFYLWIAVLCFFYGYKINQKKQCEKIGDEEKARKIKRQMKWFIPLSIVILFAFFCIEGLILEYLI